MKERLSSVFSPQRHRRLGVHFGIWLWVALSAYAFGLALWRVCVLPDVLPDVLKLMFNAAWLVLLACAAFIPRALAFIYYDSNGFEND